ncbi:MAG: MBL fold metallo-hydrolase [bacterium]|nr:MBL fold metallo-hydrolase [bacterium]
MSLTLTLLGTGTPTPLAHRAGSSYLVTLDNRHLLIDCGPGAVRRLLDKGVRTRDIETLFLTHLHYDHCVDYGYLVLNRWDQGAGEIPELNVYGPPPLQHMTHLLFDEEGVYGPDLAARTRHPGSEFIFEKRGGILPRQRPTPRITEVEHGNVIEQDGWKLTVAEVVHCQPQLTCLAYRLDTAHGTIVFGGDSAPTPKLTKLAKGADVLLHMCHFLNNFEMDARITDCCSGHQDAARAAKDADVDTLVLVHITEQLEQPGIRERLIHQAAEIFSGNIIFAEDLLDIPVGKIAPEQIL